MLTFFYKICKIVDLSSELACRVESINTISNTYTVSRNMLSKPNKKSKYKGIGQARQRILPAITQFCFIFPSSYITDVFRFEPSYYRVTESQGSMQICLERIGAMTKETTLSKLNICRQTSLKVSKYLSKLLKFIHFVFIV